MPSPLFLRAWVSVWACGPRPRRGCGNGSQGYMIDLFFSCLFLRLFFLSFFLRQFLHTSPYNPPVGLWSLMMPLIAVAPLMARVVFTTTFSEVTYSCEPEEVCKQWIWFGVPVGVMLSLAQYIRGICADMPSPRYARVRATLVLLGS
jgi:hypothetical protein